MFESQFMQEMFALVSKSLKVVYYIIHITCYTINSDQYVRQNIHGLSKSFKRHSLFYNDSVIGKLPNPIFEEYRTASIYV